MTTSGEEAGTGTRFCLPRFHVIVGDDLLLEPNPHRFADALGPVVRAGGGGLALHIRGRTSTGRVVFERAALAVDLCRGEGSWVMINDRVDIALAVGAHGVQLREDSLPASAVRSVLPSGSELLVGRSMHDPKGVIDCVDYVIFGTVFETPSHPGRNGVGIDGVSVAVGSRSTPLLAIGGVTPERVKTVLAAGAYGVVVKSGIWSHNDPAAAVLSYLESFPQEPS